MLTLRDPVTGDPIRVRAPQGTTLAVGCALPADTVTCTLIRVMLVGDILRRVLEDLHHIPVASALISDDPDILHRAGVHAVTIAPQIDVLPTAAAARRALGKPLDILVATHHCARQDPLNCLPATTTVIQVGPVHWVAPGQHCETDPATLRYVLALAPYQHELVLTSARLDHGEEQLHRWRQRMSQWSPSRTHPIPYMWRAAIVTALEDDLDVAAAVDTMNTLEHSTAVAPGAKFQALAFLDRFLAADLTRTADHKSRPPAQTP